MVDQLVDLVDQLVELVDQLVGIWWAITLDQYA